MEEYEVIRIPVSDGTEKEFAIMDTFTVEEKHYMAVSLIAEDEIQEGVYLYRYRDAEDGDIVVKQIQDRDYPDVLFVPGSVPGAFTTGKNCRFCLQSWILITLSLSMIRLDTPEEMRR